MKIKFKNKYYYQSQNLYLELCFLSPSFHHLVFPPSVVFLSFLSVYTPLSSFFINLLMHELFIGCLF